MMHAHLVLWCTLWLSFVLLCSSKPLDTESEERLTISMPHANPEHDDAYLCTTLHLNKDTKYVTGYQPTANMSKVHHMLLYACQYPGSYKTIFPCFTPCPGRNTIIYAWGRQAPPLDLPNDVSFQIGGSSGYNYLTLQVHYLHANNKNDTSGVILTLSKKPSKYQAGVFLLMSDGSIPPNSHKVTLDTGCQYDNDLEMHPFAFRTHAHALGRTIVAYVENQNTGKLLEIGRASPQWPQAFYPTNRGIVVRKGDLLIGRCVYDSMHRHEHTHIGATHMDEMCNFYIMYYVNKGALISSVSCDELQPSNFLKKFPSNSTDYLPMEIPTDYFNRADPQQETKVVSKHTKKTVISHATSSHSRFMVDETWKVDATLGQVGGVTMDSKRVQVIIYHRGTRVWDGTTFDENEVIRFTDPIDEDTVYHVDSDSGRVVQQWGSGLFYLPHGIYLDQRLSHLWFTDVGAHQVMRFQYGQWKSPTLTLGTLRVPGHDEKHFCKPADVVTNAKGEIFVADGYCNSRIVKFSPDGEFVKSWGSNHGDFLVVHSITVVEPLGWICVADRERAAIECFDFDGNGKGRFQSSAEMDHVLGDAVFAIRWDTIGRQLLGVSVVGKLPHPKRAFGFRLPLQNNQLLDTPKIKLWSGASENSHLSTPHGMTVSENGEQIFVAQLDAAKVIKFIQHFPNSKIKIPLETSVHHEKGHYDDNAAMHRILPHLFETTRHISLSNIATLVGIVVGAPALIIVCALLFVRTCHKIKQLFCCCRDDFSSQVRNNRRFRRKSPFRHLKTDESDLDEAVSLHPSKGRSGTNKPKL